MKRGLLLGPVIFIIILIIFPLTNANIFDFFKEVLTVAPTNNPQQGPDSSYYPIWEHLTNPEKALYDNNFNTFYQEFKEMEALGVVKWHPEEKAVIYGRGYNVNEIGCQFPFFFNNSIFCMSTFYWDSIYNLNLNGTLEKVFGYRNTHYYPDGFAIDKDYIFVTGFGDTNSLQYLRRYYFNNATPAPFILNGQETFEAVCASAGHSCPPIYSDGKFLYQTDRKIISRENLEVIGQLVLPPSISGEIIDFASKDNLLFVDYGRPSIYQPNSTILVYNTDDFGPPYSLNPQFPESYFVVPSSFGYTSASISTNGTSLFYFFLKGGDSPSNNCENSMDCGAGQGCMFDSDLRVGKCEKICSAQEECEGYCKTHELGFCKNTPSIVTCRKNSDCPPLSSECIKNWCDDVHLSSIYSFNGALLGQRNLQELDDYTRFSGRNIKSMHLSGNYLSFISDGVMYIFYNNNLSLVSQTPVFSQQGPSAQYAMLPLKTVLLGGGYLSYYLWPGTWPSGWQVGPPRKPSGELVTKNLGNTEMSQNQEVSNDICKGSEGGQQNGYYDHATFNNQKYKLVSFFDQIPGVNVFALPDESDSQNCTSHADCRAEFYCKTSPWDKTNKKCKKACETNLDCYEMPQDYILECIKDGVCSNNADIPCKSNSDCNDPDSDNPQGVCIKKFCEKQPQFVKFINFSTIYDYTGWPGGVAVDDSTIPWKMYVNFLWAPSKNGKQLGGIRVYSVDPTNNFDWQELGEIIPSSREQLPYWPYVSDEWWVIPTFGWYDGKIPWVDKPYKGGGGICLVTNEEGKKRIYVGTGRQGRIIAFLSPKVLGPPYEVAYDSELIEGIGTKTSQDSITFKNDAAISINEQDPPRTEIQCEQQGGICIEAASCLEGYTKAEYSCQDTQDTVDTTSESVTGSGIFDTASQPSTTSGTTSETTPATNQICCIKTQTQTTSTSGIFSSLTGSVIKGLPEKIYASIFNFIKKLF